MVVVVVVVVVGVVSKAGALEAPENGRQAAETRIRKIR